MKGAIYLKRVSTNMPTHFHEWHISGEGWKERIMKAERKKKTSVAGGDKKASENKTRALWPRPSRGVTLRAASCHLSRTKCSFQTPPAFQPGGALQKALSSQSAGEIWVHNTAIEEELCQKPSSVVELIMYFQLICQMHLVWLNAQQTPIPPMNWDGSGARSFVFPSRVLVAVTGPDCCWSHVQGVPQRNSKSPKWTHKYNVEVIKCKVRISSVSTSPSSPQSNDFLQEER